MKSPTELAEQLTRQWHNPRLREQRLLSAEAWPIELAIGLPKPDTFAQTPERLRQHLRHWRAVRAGEVEWSERRFRLIDGPVELPSRWRLRKPSEWVAACADRQVSDDYALLSRLIQATDTQFHGLLIRQLSQLRKTSEAEVSLGVQIALQLEPGMAQGKPLRALALGNDSKFFERHRRLLTLLLDQRFAGAASEQGLEAFLGAVSERDHWLLVVPLDARLLPFEQQRVRAAELRQTPLPARKILLVENEQCLHQLPQTPDCIAVLGAGLNLEWLHADWLADRQIGYWGDVDTWGLAMLAKARASQPKLRALLMDRRTFEQFADKAVVEPVPYSGAGLAALSRAESALFQHLKTSERGRLEQEFVAPEAVAIAVRAWVEHDA